MILINSEVSDKTSHPASRYRCLQFDIGVYKTVNATLSVKIFKQAADWTVAIINLLVGRIKSTTSEVNLRTISCPCDPLNILEFYLLVRLRSL